MNLSQLGPLTILRQVPLIGNGASFAYIKGGEPRFALMLLDPNDHSTDPGISDLFDDGVTFYPSYIIPTKYWGKSGKHTIAVAVTTKQFTPFDTIKQIILPGPPVSPLQGRTGSWSVNYEFSQRIVERARHDGWGLFSQVSIADTKTSPITEFVSVALVGNGLSNKRPKDEFGIGYSFTNASRDLKDLINVATTGRLVPEHDFEMFYNLHLTPWARLTGDLQVLRGVRSIAQPAVVPAVRLELVF
jgi:porin